MSFGASGDLAFKKMFPPCTRCRGATRWTWVIGVASLGPDHGGSSRARAPASRRRRARMTPPRAPWRRRAGYVDGDYDDRDVRAARASWRRPRPRAYLAIPPSVFAAVVEHLAGADCLERRARHRREAVRPGPCLGAPLNQTLHRLFPRALFSASITTSVRRRSRISCTSVSPTLFRANVESPLRRERADHAGRILRRQGAARSTKRPASFAT